MPDHPLPQIIHKLTISGPVSHLVTRQELADLAGELFVFGAMIRKPRKLGGFHELLFRREVSSSKQGQTAYQGSHSIIHMAVHHLFMQLVQTIHDRLVLLVQFFNAYGVLTLPDE